MNAPLAVLVAVMMVSCTAGAIILALSGHNTLATVLGGAAAAGFAAVYQAASKSIHAAIKKAEEADEKAGRAEKRADAIFEATQTLTKDQTRK